MYKREIVYDRETRDYAYYCDGELVGFARTYHDAEEAINEHVFNLRKYAGRTATELDQD